MNHQRTNRKSKTRNEDGEPAFGVAGRFFNNERVAAIGLGCLTLQLVWVMLLPGDSVAVELGQSLLIVWPSLLAAVCAFSLVPTLSGEMNRSVRMATLCWGLLAIWIWVAVAANAGEANVRAAINEAWYWTAIACSFFAAQFCVRTVQQRRAVAAVFIAMIGMLVFHAVYQYWVTMPEIAQRIAADPDRLLLDAGIDGTADPIRARLYLDRALAREPYATFALTNSLAGLLLAAITYLFAILCDIGQVHRQARMRGVLGAIVVGAAVVLFLTKSRTALILLPVGLLWSSWLAWGAERGLSISRRGLMLAGGGVALLLAIGFIVLIKNDQLVLSQTRQSLGVRLDYWQASIRMIAARPVVGFGPGNFQSAYYGYRSPAAHETIADPHNFVLELGATAGIPAIVLFVVASLMSMKALFRYRIDPESKLPPPQVGAHFAGLTERKRGEESQLHGVRPVVAGALIGLPTAWLGGLVFSTAPEIEPYFGGIPLGILVFVLLRHWIHHGWLSRFGTMGAFLILLCHLLASGGITVPGMFMPLVLLLACRLPHAWNPALDTIGGRVVIAGHTFSKSLVALPLLLCLCFGYLTWRRVQYARQAMGNADDLLRRGNVIEARNRLQMAAEVEPYDPRVSSAVSRAELSRVFAGRARWTPAAEGELEANIARDRRNPQGYRQAGDTHLYLYQLGRQVEHLRRARDYYQAGLERFPTAIRLAVQLALVQQALGEAEIASQLAANALQRIAEMDYFENSVESEPLIAIDLSGRPGRETESLQVRATAANLAGKSNVKVDQVD